MCVNVLIDELIYRVSPPFFFFRTPKEHDLSRGIRIPQTDMGELGMDWSTLFLIKVFTHGISDSFSLVNSVSGVFAFHFVNFFSWEVITENRLQNSIKEYDPLIVVD